MAKNNIAKTEAVALEYLALNAGSRAVYQAEKGVGLNAGATYVSRYVEAGALKASVEAVKAGKLEWKEGEVVVVVSGNKGTSARFGRVSKCGGFVECVGTTGAKGVLSVGIFGEKGSLEVLNVADAAKRAAKGQVTRFVRSHDGQTFIGRTLASLDNDVCAMAYGAKGGRLLFVDIETDKSNVYNTEMRGHCGGEADADALALTEEVIAAVASGKADRKGHTKKGGEKKGKGKK